MSSNSDADNGNSKELTQLVMLTDDFRVSVELDFFDNIEFVHLHSAAYEEPASQHSLGGTLTVINGYTEWVSKISPIISIGWDWELCYENANCHYVKTGGVFSNVAFHVRELSETLVALNEEQFIQQQLDNKIAQIGWENKIFQYITQLV
ncbi:MAG: DUF4902 domain-containing protein [Enterobacteriaceae bacterium]|nr:DUF4902 domain-containing protein [Enterobacteriaceae bacterium]